VPAITARFQGYRLVLDPVGFGALRACLPQRWHPLLDAVSADAYVERLALDTQLNQIGELGPARSGIVVDRHVLRHLLLTGLTVHTGLSEREAASTVASAARLHASADPTQPPAPA